MSSTPKVLLPPVWPLPLSLATTRGISVDFSSSPYLDVSVQAVPHIRLCVQRMLHVHSNMQVSPFGNPWINAHLQLPTAYRSLSRPSSAPSAKAFPLCSFLLDSFPYQRSPSGPVELYETLKFHKVFSGKIVSYPFSFALPVSRFSLLSIIQFSRCVIGSAIHALTFPCESGGLRWTRTIDLTLIRRAL